MQLRNNYWYFQSTFSPEICQDIVSLGKNKIDLLKKQGVSTQALTRGDNQKKKQYSNSTK